MAMIGTCTMAGGSGDNYEFNVYASGVVFNDFIPGIFVVCKDDEVLLVGESDHVDHALSRHEKKPELEERGANRICFHRVANPAKRKAAMEDILKNCSPAL